MKRTHKKSHPKIIIYWSYKYLNNEDLEKNCYKLKPMETIAMKVLKTLLLQAKLCKGKSVVFHE